METSYQTIFESFINKISDHKFLSLPDDRIEYLCQTYLTSAITKFRKCKKNLRDRDDFFQSFNFELDDKEIEILANLMIVEWLTPQIYSIMNLKQVLPDKEFKMFSQANHLAEIRALRESCREEADGLIIEYTYEEDDLEALR